jgi:hypothetical protein
MALKYQIFNLPDFFRWQVLVNVVMLPFVLCQHVLNTALQPGEQTCKVLFVDTSIEPNMDSVYSRTLAKYPYRIHLLIYRLAVCTEQIMSTPTGRQVRQLYRDLLRYGRQLQFTDKDYFANRIRKEFKQAKDIEKSDDIIFYFQVSCVVSIGSEALRSRSHTMVYHSTPICCQLLLPLK